jgi:hypothetical protein
VQRHHVDARLSAGEDTSPRLLRPELRLQLLGPVYAKYTREGMSGAEIARLLGIRPHMVYADRARMGLRGATGAARTAKAVKVSADVRREATATRTEKRCGGPCGRVLPLDAFNRETRSPDGRTWQCRECYAKAREARRAALAGESQVAATSVELWCCTALYEDGRWVHDRSCPARHRPTEAAQAAGRQDRKAAAERGELAGDDEAIADVFLPWRQPLREVGRPVAR